MAVVITWTKEWSSSNDGFILYGADLGNIQDDIEGHSHSDDMSYANTRFKVGSFTRDVSAASGTQAVTGVGFTPKAVILFANIHGTARISWGLDDVTTHHVMEDVSGGLYGNSIGISIYIFVDGSNYYLGEVSSFDADGFTVTWRKTGSLTGTVTVCYLALR